MPPAWKVLIGLNTLATIVVLVAVPYLYTQNQSRIEENTARSAKSPCLANKQGEPVDPDRCQDLLRAVANGSVFPLELTCRIVREARLQSQSCTAQVRKTGRTPRALDQESPNSTPGQAPGPDGKRSPSSQGPKGTSQPPSPGSPGGQGPAGQPGGPGSDGGSTNPPPALLDTCLQNPLLAACLKLDLPRLGGN